MEIKVSVVVTVKNDEPGIFRLKKGLDRQTVKPDEVIIIRAEDYGDCSRGKGRNIGVKMARNQVIAVTDAGCRPHKDWIEDLVGCLEADKGYKDYKDNKDRTGRHLETSSRSHPVLPIFAVAGGYRAAAKTELQRIMAYFLIPRDYFEETPRLGGESPLSESRFPLPASRSIMFTKQAWEAVGGYPEEARSGGEDLEFARRLAAHPDIKMIYCPEAVVDWEPPKSLGEFFRDMVKHTRGNVEIMYWPHLWRNLNVVLRWGVFLVFPWMIPIYFGIKVIKIIKIRRLRSVFADRRIVTFWNIIGGLRSHLGIRQGDTLNLFRSLLFIPVVQAAADAGVVWGLVLGIMSRMGRMGRMS